MGRFAVGEVPIGAAVPGPGVGDGLGVGVMPMNPPTPCGFKPRAPDPDAAPCIAIAAATIRVDNGTRFTRVGYKVRWFWIVGF